MNKVSIFVLDFDDYDSSEIINWLSRRIDTSALKSKQKIFSQFIRYYVLEKVFNIYDPIFSYNSGKPYLYGRDLFFNISHTGNKVMIAFAGYEVGVDIENLSSRRNILKVAKRYFSNSEFQAIENSINKQEKFFTLWTLKESEVKRSAKGIAKGLKVANFSMDSQENWISGNFPNDFVSLICNEHVISVCMYDIKNIEYELFQIVDFEFERINL